MEINNMEINVNQMIHITIDDDFLLSWSYDRYTGIYTFVQTDKTVWIYDSKIKNLSTCIKSRRQNIGMTQSELAEK